MSFRGLLVVIGLFAASVCVLLWLGRRAAPPEVASPDAPLVRAFSEDALREIDLACGGAAVTLGREPSGGWRVTRPFQAEADPRRVHEVVAALQDARIRKVIAETAASREAFGLSPAACTVRLGFEAGAPTITLRLGRGSPVGSERYAEADDAHVVFTDGSLHGVVARGPEAFREKRIIPAEPESVTRIVLERPDGRLVIATVGDGWRLEAPRDDVASPSACRALARAVTSIELVAGGPIQPPRTASPSRRLRLEVSVRGRDTPFSASVATAGIQGRRLAWTEGRDLVGLIEDSAARELERPSESYRDSRIASFSTPEVRQVTIERGGTTLRIVRAGEASPWSGSAGSEAFVVDGARVETLLDQLRALTGAGFEPKGSETKATGTITVSGERGDLARVTFGPLDSSSGVDVESLWITTPTRPGVVFRIAASSFGPVPAKAADLAKSSTTVGAGGGS